MFESAITADGAWIQTRTGRAVLIKAPRAEDVCLDDIAYHLAGVMRFTGATHSSLSPHRYSVGQHSVLVSLVVERFARLAPEVKPIDVRRFGIAGLFHDSLEYVIGDWSRPLKYIAELRPILTRLERLHEFAICAWLWSEIGGGLVEWDHPLVKRADNLLCRTEARDLMSPLHSAWSPALHPSHGEVLEDILVPWSPQESEARFHARFAELVG